MSFVIFSDKEFVLNGDLAEEVKKSAVVITNERVDKERQVLAPYEGTVYKI